jgi:hypothetical protein
LESTEQAQKKSLKPRGDSQPQRKISNQTHISKTDPDATLALKKGTSRHLKYKAHLTIDAESRVIIDTKITTGACHDSQVYLNQLQSMAEHHSITIKEAIADRAYGSGQILQSLIDKNIQPTIPLFSSRSGGFILGEKDGFIYDEENDRYQCVAGKWLVPISEAKNRHCLSRAKYRGLIKTQIQAYMSACAQNMKRLVIAFLYFLFLCHYKDICISHH